MLTEKNNVEKQESDINDLTKHYQNIISNITNDISVAKKEYESVIKKRESLMIEMQSLKRNYDIVTKLKTESEQDLTSEKNLQLMNADKIQKSIEEILQQNKSLGEKVDTQIQIKNRNLQRTGETKQKISKQESLLKIIQIVLSHVEKQKSLTYDLLNANQSYGKMFDEKISSINNMKNLIDENLELLTKNTKENN